MINGRFDVHIHSTYSNIRLLDCINSPKEIVKRAISLGLKGFAITDHESLSGHVTFNKLQEEIQKENPNFKIALGNEIYLTNSRDKGQKYFHFILIAKDEIGCKLLRELSSLAWLQSYKDRIERVPTLKSELKEMIEKYGKGHLIGTTACLGGELSTLVKSLIIAEHSANVSQYVQKVKEFINDFICFCKNCFENDFYIEVAPGCSKEQIAVNKRLLSIAKFYNVKMVIGSDSHYLTKEDRNAHKTYLNSQEGEREVDLFYEYAYLQDDADIYEHLLKSFEEKDIDDMVLNSFEIYDKIKNYSLFHKQHIPEVPVKDYPKTLSYFGNNNSLKDELDSNYPTLKSMLLSADIRNRYWANQCLTGLIEKDLFNETYLTRLEDEARVKGIISEKLETNMYMYPVMIQHYIDLIWECGSSIGAGRGSAGAGLNHYLLGITQSDPIKWEMPFFRYLNEERVELGGLLLICCQVVNKTCELC